MLLRRQAIQGQSAPPGEKPSFFLRSPPKVPDEGLPEESARRSGRFSKFQIEPHAAERGGFLRKDSLRSNTGSCFGCTAGSALLTVFAGPYWSPAERAVALL